MDFAYNEHLVKFLVDEKEINKVFAVTKYMVDKFEEHYSSGNFKYNGFFKNCSLELNEELKKGKVVIWEKAKCSLLLSITNKPNIYVYEFFGDLDNNPGTINFNKYKNLIWQILTIGYSGNEGEVTTSTFAENTPKAKKKVTYGVTTYEELEEILNTYPTL